MATFKDYYNQGKYQDAVDAALKVTQEKPTDYEALVYLAYAY